MRVQVQTRVGGRGCALGRPSRSVSKHVVLNRRRFVVVRAEGEEAPKPAETEAAAAPAPVEGGDAVAAPEAPEAPEAAEATADDAAVAVVRAPEAEKVPAKYVDTGMPPEEWRGYKWSEIKRMNKGRPKPLWYPGGTSPEHLKGELAGDFGFDPLSLGSDPELLTWFQQAELQHARWAMVGVVGIVVPEILSLTAGTKPVLWTEAGAGNYIFPWQGLLATQLLMMGWAEQRRWQDLSSPGSVNTSPVFEDLKWADDGNDLGYPGGDVFDPLRYQFKFNQDKDLEKEYREKEIKNGRLAMVALVGFAAQTFVTGNGPIQNLLDHLADQGHQTIFSNMGHF